MSYSNGGKMPSTYVEDYESSEPWVEAFCRKRGNEYFCEIPEDFLLDKFNLTNLGLESSKRVDAAYRLLIDDYNGEVDENGLVPSDVESAAKKLYGLIHQRYLQTPQGLAQIHKKYMNGVYGNCPRVLCESQGLLPMGLSDTLGVDSVKLYCMRCEDIYLPKSSAHNKLDGAAFGTSLPHLYILSNKIQLAPYEERAVKFVPRIFGFRLADPDFVKQIEERESQQSLQA